MQLDQMLELYWFIVCHQNRKARPPCELDGRKRREQCVFLGWAILNLITRNLLFLFCVCHWLSARSCSFDMNGKEWIFFIAILHHGLKIAFFQMASTFSILFLDFYSPFLFGLFFLFRLLFSLYFSIFFEHFEFLPILFCNLMFMSICSVKAFLKEIVKTLFWNWNTFTMRTNLLNWCNLVSIS